MLAGFSLMGGSLHFGAAAATPSPVPETPAPTETPAPSPTPEPEPEEFIITLIGDITPDAVAAHKGTAAAYQNVVGENYTYVFENTRDYFTEDDFTIANFECVMSDDTTAAADKNFTFRCPTAYSAMLTDGSVEFVTLGNNHVLDFGESGYADTKAAMDAAGIGYAGRDEYSIYETASGLKIGVYASSFGTTEGVRAGVKALRDKGAEFIIYAMHLGDEGSYSANADQIEQAHAAIDAGADVVYGSHPHTLQPVEQYEGRYIFYSMGNWSFGGNTNPRDKDTCIARLTVIRDTDGSVSIGGVEVIPCASSGVTDGNNYQPVPYEKGSEEYERTMSKLNGTFEGSDLTIGYTYGFSEYSAG